MYLDIREIVDTQFEKIICVEGLYTRSKKKKKDNLKDVGGWTRGFFTDNFLYIPEKRK